jgi:hypothetical protein
VTLGESFDRITSTQILRRDGTPLSSLQIVGWWELRRIPYNLIVGFSGLLTICVMVAVEINCERRTGVSSVLPDPPIFALFGAIVYAFMANVCFTGGWVVELLLVHGLGIRPRRFAQVAFALGLLGSVLLTILPAALTVLSIKMQGCPTTPVD